MAIDRPRGLIAVTSVERLPSGQRAGFWLPEAAYPWRAMVTAGWDFEFVTTRDEAPAPGGIDRSDPPQRMFLEDAEVRRKLAGARTARHYDPADFPLVFAAGGPGAMWDFPGDAGLGALLVAVHEAGGVVAAVCHGVAALVNARCADGSAFVAGRQLTGFSNREEEAIGLSAAVPFLLEDALVERGAKFEAGEPFRSHTVCDDRLVTGQNPASAADVAQLATQLATGRQLPVNWLRRPAP
jgi:putative intracellular protease/amidase